MTMIRPCGVTVSFVALGFREPWTAREFQLRYFFVHTQRKITCQPQMKML